MNPFDMIKNPLEGINLLEAAAGTGKTYTIAGLFLRLVLEKDLPVEKILVVTFTKAATEELRERIRNKLRMAAAVLTGEIKNSEDELLVHIARRYAGGEKQEALFKLRRALLGFDEAAVFTIHGFCQRMLQEGSFESNSLFDTSLVGEKTGLIKEIAEDFFRREFYDAPPLLLHFILKDFSIERLIFLAGKKSLDPSFTTVPNIPDIQTVNILKMLDGLNETYKKAKSLWESESEKIREIITRAIADRDLNGTSYNERYMDSRYRELKNFCNSDFPAPFSDKLEFFTSKKLSEKTNNNKTTPDHPFFDACDEYKASMEQVRGKLHDYIIFLKQNFLKYMELELPVRRHDKNIRSYDDLLEDLYRALSGPSRKTLLSRAREKFSAALIDEFQDTDALQYGIFTALFEHKDSVLFLIGDPKQAIYKFRGADVFAYIQAASKIKNRYTLGTNWRSDPHHLEAVNTIFQDLKDPFVFDEKLVGYSPIRAADKKDREKFTVDGKEASGITLWFLRSGSEGNSDKKKIINKPDAVDKIGSAVAAEIARLIGPKGAMIGDRALVPGDIAVLVRKKHQAGKIKEHLQGAGIRSVMFGAGSIFFSTEAEEMERIMLALVEPGNEKLVKAALVTSILGKDGNSLLKLMADETEWEKVLLQFTDYHRQWMDHGFIYMFRNLLADFAVRAAVLSQQGGERKMTNILHCAELLHQAESERRPGTDGLLRWFSETRSRKEENDENEMRLETDDDAVKISTIHGSKGLEYSVVFAPFLWEGVRKPDVEYTFHDDHDSSKYSSRLMLDLGSGNEENKKLYETEELAESLRLFYVAITRAKYRTYTAWGPVNESEDSAPAYVFHRPPELDEMDLAGSLADYFKKLSEDDLYRRLMEISNKSGGSIKLKPVPDTPAYTISGKTPETKLSYREFTGIIKKDWRISSFSSLIREKPEHHDSPDRDQERFSLPVPENNEKKLTIFNFPRGAAAGTCIHSIFEDADFTGGDGNVLQELVAQKVHRYSFDLKWVPVLSEMVRNVLSTEIHAGGEKVRLEKVTGDMRLTELEFMFPMRTITFSGFNDMLYDNRQAQGNVGGRKVDEIPDISSHRGFMHGFIDLVFRYQDRYYLADWKSNYLGDRPEDYGSDSILRAMMEHRYDMQYHIYTVALNQYLNKLFPGEYTYEKNFGGVLYFFVRGMGPVGGQCGIYFDKPSTKMVEELAQYIIKENNMGAK